MRGWPWPPCSTPAVAGPELWEACDARDGYLERLCTLYYVPETGALRDELDLQGGDLDLLFIEAINLESAYLGRDLELAVVARLRDAFCAGVGIIVVNAATEEESSGWARIGFVHSGEGEAAGLMHLDTALRTPRVVDELREDDRIAFKVLPKSRRLSEQH